MHVENYFWKKVAVNHSERKIKKITLSFLCAVKGEKRTYQFSGINNTHLVVPEETG